MNDFSAILMQFSKNSTLYFLSLFSIKKVLFARMSKTFTFVVSFIIVFSKETLIEVV